MSQISIIIITLNEKDHIGEILSDLTVQTFKDFEVIVVDSNSQDKTCEIAEQFSDKLPKLTIHRMKNRGVSLGRNTGAKIASYPRLLFLDADVRLAPDFLEKSILTLDKKRLQVAGIFMGAKELPLHYKIGYSVFNLGLFITQFTFPTAVGACIFSSLKVHQSINGFDEKINLCEDCDYVKRAGKIHRFRFLFLTFQFNPRRLQQDGFLRTGLLYLRANTYRFFFGEIRNNEIEYEFGHYHDENKS